MTDTTTSAPAVSTESTAATTPEGGVTAAQSGSVNPSVADSAQKPAEGTSSTSEQSAKPAEKTESDKPAEKPAVPEKYEFKAPEGVRLDDSVVAGFSEAAKRLNLSQDDAQSLINELSPKIAESQKQAQEIAMSKAREEWANTSKVDKEFGGDNFNKNISVAKKAIDAFATDEMKQLLEQSGLGSHPEVIRTFFRMGQKISEDGHVPASGTKAPRDVGTILYDKS